jgi:hypothetical protein
MVRLVLLMMIPLAGCAPLRAPADPQARFFNALSGLCGKAFAGRIVSAPVAADADFAGKPMIMHVRECSDEAIRIPFHVGEDRSRTWVISRTPAGLRLKHDHRHEDGSADDLTQYGGDTAMAGTAARQEFPADDYSKAMFIRRNAPQSVPNVWAVDIQPGRSFAYELRRPGRHFRVEFDLTRPVAAPPPPWGAR